MIAALAAATESAAISPLRAAVVTLLIGVGSFFLLIGTVGLVRFPNVYNRLHATSKATTLGAASLFLAGFVFYGPQGGGLVSLVGIVFLFITAPTGGHVLSRAAQRMGVPFEPGVEWPGAGLDLGVEGPDRTGEDETDAPEEDETDAPEE